MSRIAKCIFTKGRDVPVADELKNTMVTVLGWAGSKDQALRKYSELYERRGLDNIRFIARFEPTAMENDKKELREVSHLADTLTNYLTDSNKSIIFHALSMNSIYTLVSLQEKYPHIQVFQRTKAIFFDSCPIQFSDSSTDDLLKVMDIVYKKRLNSPSFYVRLMHFLHKKKTLFDVRLNRLLKNLGVSSTSTYDYLLNHPHLPRHLCFAYSDNDDICAAKYIHAFHEQLSDRGTHQVLFHNFQTSEHVKHLSEQPDVYNDLLDRFLHNISHQHSKL